MSSGSASLNLNFLAAVRMCRAVVPGMLAAGSGVIVNVASVNAFLPDPGVMDYSAAKGALLNFAKALSKEVGPAGIRVNSVDPGPVATDLWLGNAGVAQTVGAANGIAPEQVAENALSRRRRSGSRSRARWRRWWRSCRRTPAEPDRVGDHDRRRAHPDALTRRRAPGAAPLTCSASARPRVRPR